MWSNKSISPTPRGKHYKCLGSEEAQLVNERPPSSIVSLATSSSASVASTVELIKPIKSKVKKYLGTGHKMNPGTQKELNMMMSIESNAKIEERIHPGLLTKEMDTASESSTSSGISYAALLPQILAAVAVSLGSLVVGFSSGYTSPALVSMNQTGPSYLLVTSQQASWIGSLMPLSAMFGGILGGPFIGSFGRRTTILLTAFPFIISYILISMAKNVAWVMVGRAVTGFCVGVASLALPVYLGEAVQPEVRGTLGLLPTTFGNGGILLCMLVGKYFDWSGLAMLGAALPVPFLIFMCLIPETPRWYIGKGKQKRALKSLIWLRGKNANVSKELNDIQISNDSAQQSTSVKDLFTRSYLWPLLISLGLMFFQQLSGINAVIFYSVTIFRDAGSSIDSNISAIIVGAVNLGSTLVATALIDRLGRKILLYISNTLMTITLFVLGGFFYLKSSGMDITGYGWVPLASFVIFVIGFSIGAGPIPWLMMGEILPAKVRGTAASLVTAFNWAWTFIVTKTFVDMTIHLGSHGAFWLFGFICLIGIFFVYFFVPETQGKSLEDIEKHFMAIGSKIPDTDIRRMSSTDNLKP